MTASESDDHNVVELAESPGRRLRVQRQSRGIEIERIATQLHLRNDVVEALEQDRYEALPAPVYVAGYLRNYARLIGLDPTLIVNAYHAATAHADERVTSVVPVRQPRRAGRSGNLPTRLIGLVMVGAVIGLSILWWQNRAGQGAESGSAFWPSLFGASQTAAREDETGLDEPAPAADINPLEEQAEPVLPERPMTAPVEKFSSDALAATPAIAQNEPEPTPFPVPALAESGRVSNPPTPEATEPLSADSDEEAEPATALSAEVVLEFSGASWVSVMGSDGNVVLNGEMRAGDRRVLEGRPPYKFVIGNASATRMTLGGEAFDLIGRSRGNVARFTLDPQNPQ
nr:RodZ domain-containing protein [uncultured Thiocystis sp.]